MCSYCAYVIYDALTALWQKRPLAGSPENRVNPIIL